MAKVGETILDVTARPESSEKRGQISFDQFTEIMRLQHQQMRMQMQIQHEELKGMVDALKFFASSALLTR